MSASRASDENGAIERTETNGGSAGKGRTGKAGAASERTEEKNEQRRLVGEIVVVWWGDIQL